MPQLDTQSTSSPASKLAAVRAEDLGLLILRLAFGLALASHGAQKLFGWFNGNGLDRTSGFFEKLGYEPGGAFAALAGASELGGGLLLAAGLFMPLASAIVLGVMLNAVAAEWDGGFYGGYELPLLYAAVAVVLALTGPGRHSLDQGRPWARQGLPWAGLSVALGLGTALLTLIYKGM